MGNMFKNFINYNPVKDNYKNFYEGRREVLISFEENIFPLPNPYVFCKNEWKEKDLDREEFMPKNSVNESVLERLGHRSLSEKRN